MASPRWKTRRPWPLAASTWTPHVHGSDSLVRGGALALRLEQGLLLDDAGGDLGKAQVALAGSLLQTAERVVLGEAERRHQQPLRALDELPIFERLLRAI